MNSSAIGLFSLMSKHFLNTLDLFITNNDHFGTIARDNPEVRWRKMANFFNSEFCFFFGTFAIFAR